YLAEHRKILELAAKDELPNRIDSDSELSVKAFSELYEQGLVDGADATSMDGPQYLEPRITMRGREYLNDLQQRAAEASPAGKARRIGLRALDWSLGIVAGVLIALGARMLA